MKVWSLDNIQRLMSNLGEVELLIKKQNLNAMNILYNFIITQAKTNN